MPLLNFFSGCNDCTQNVAPMLVYASAHVVQKTIIFSQ